MYPLESLNLPHPPLFDSQTAMKTPNVKLDQWHQFLTTNPKVEFVWLQVLSYSSRPYVRIVPTARFTEILQSRKYVSVPTAAFSFDPEDHLVEGSSPCGTFYLCPDLDTIYCQPGSEGTRAVVQCNCVDEDDTPIDECARSRLQMLDELVQRETGLTALVGFEVELVLMKAESQPDGTVQYRPLSDVHNWSCVTLEDIKILGVLESISRALDNADVQIEQFHAECAPAQWEFVLPPAPPVQSIDMLLRARETIRTVAFSHGLHATLYPRPSPDHAGTGAHVHISLNGPGEEDRLAANRVEPFFAGLVQHMPAILAFALPMEQSYDRLKAGIWSGGEYACWGWENKETPLRRVKDNRFEFKLMDGLANPFLSLAAIFAAGLEGLRSGTALQGGPCPQAAADLGNDERRKLGVNVLLPRTLQESLTALEGDACLCDALSKQVVTTYGGLKRGEAKWFGRMEPEQQMAWLISRH